MEGLGRGVGSVEVGGRILAVLAEKSSAMMLRDIAQEAQLTPGQAHAYLVSYRKLGLVEQDGVSGQYQLGPFALQIGLSRLRSSDPHQIVWEAVPEVTAKLGLSATMSIWGHCGPVIVRVHEAPYQIYSNIRPGARYSLFDTATGRLFAAFGNKKLVDMVLKTELKERFEAKSRTVRVQDYRAGLTDVRNKGYAITQGVPIPGIGAVSVPVFDLGGKLLAGITAIGPENAIDYSESGETISFMLTFARRLTMNLGGDQQGQAE